MSTLRTNTLSNAAGSASVPVDTVISGSAKAWVNCADNHDVKHLHRCLWGTC